MIAFRGFNLHAYLCYHLSHVKLSMHIWSLPILVEFWELSGSRFGFRSGVSGLVGIVFFAVIKRLRSVSLFIIVLLHFASLFRVTSITFSLILFH